MSAAAASAATEALREKDTKINELVEELGSKELLLSEAQAQLAAVRWLGRGSGCGGCPGPAHQSRGRAALRSACSSACS